MITIIIVNWNAGHQLYDCIDSVLQHSCGLVRKIVVVDNGSTDSSLQKIDGLPGVIVIRAGKNLGFAAACNIGTVGVDSPYLLFLNPDTRLESNSLQVPLAFMECEENAGVGICGLQLVDKFGQTSRSCSKFPSLQRLMSSILGFDKVPGFRGTGMRMTYKQHLDSKRVDQVMGAFFLIRRETFEICNGFDERFFVYFEEVDLSKRAKESGWNSWFLADARAFHAGGGTSRQVKAKRLFYSLSSRLLYAFKHFPLWQAWVLVFATLMLEPISRTIFCLINRDLIGIKNTFSAYRMLTSAMPRIMKGKSVSEL